MMNTRAPHCLYKCLPRRNYSPTNVKAAEKSRTAQINAQSVEVVAAVRGGKVVICKGVYEQSDLDAFPSACVLFKKFHGQSRWRCCWYWDNIRTARIAYLYEHKWAALEFLCCCWAWLWSVNEIDRMNCINKVPPAEFIIWMDVIFCVCSSSKKCVLEKFHKLRTKVKFSALFAIAVDLRKMR